MFVKTLFVVAALCVVSVHCVLHASCRITWNFGVPCTQVSSALEQQMNTWKTADNCKNGGEKCLYAVKTSSANQLTGTHTTPVKHYVDDLTFTFKTSGNSCAVTGYSTSEVWYAVLDYGTNYCNLHNLVTGAGLDKVTGYSETTNDSICTQYSSSNCEKY